MPVTARRRPFAGVLQDSHEAHCRLSFKIAGVRISDYLATVEE